MPDGAERAVAHVLAHLAYLKRKGFSPMQRRDRVPLVTPDHARLAIVDLERRGWIDVDSNTVTLTPTGEAQAQLLAAGDVGYYPTSNEAARLLGHRWYRNAAGDFHLRVGRAE